MACTLLPARAVIACLLLLAILAWSAVAVAATPPRRNDADSKSQTTARRWQPIVVDVRGDKRAPDSITLTQSEINQMPGAFGDAFRAIGAMPGVTPVVSGLPYFYVRGAPPGDIGYFIDGVRVPLLYHVGLGPSVLEPSLIRKVDLYRGAYPARYGRYTGAIVAAETTRPRRRPHATAEVRLFDAGGSVEAPLAGGRVSVLVAGRYSYSGRLLSLFAPDISLEYWDYQARASYRIAPRDNMRLFAFGSNDYLGRTSGGAKQTLVATRFHRVDVRETHVAEDGTRLVTAATLGLDRTGDDTGSTRDRSLSIRSRVSHPVGEDAVFSAGADVDLDAYDWKFDKPGLVSPDLFPSRTDLATGIWADVALEPEDGVSVTPGARIDYYASNGRAAIAVDPRISARFAVSKHVRLIHTLGIAHQPPAFMVPAPGFAIGGLRGGLQEAVQSSAGVEADLPADLHGSLTLFDNAFFNMVDPLGTFHRHAPITFEEATSGIDVTTLDRRSLGSSVGLELLVRRSLTHRLGGFVSWTLSRSMRSSGTEYYPSNADRTHVVNVVLGYALGRHWKIGTRFVFYTGIPISDPSHPSTRQSFAPIPSGPPPRDGNPVRVPPFYRIDLRIEKRWRLGRRGYLAFVAEVMNATLNKEPVDRVCDDCQVLRIGPITLPSVGVEASY